jgi:uncharacterized protein Usg
MSELAPQLKGYRLTTAEIMYHLPDYPDLLQAFIWQDLDLVPEYPVLRKFLRFWDKEIEGPIHSVRVGSTGLITPGELAHADLSFTVQ